MRYRFVMDSEDFSEFGSIDLDSQRDIEAEIHRSRFDENEERRFDGAETSKSRIRQRIDIADDDVNDNDIKDDNDKGKTSTPEDPKPKKRKQYADCWEHFTLIWKKDKTGKAVERAQCKHCKNDYAYDPHKNGTKSYNRHLEKCKIRLRNSDIGTMIVNAEAKLQARKIDHIVFREKVAKCIIQHDLLFAYVEYEKVRSVWKYLNAYVKFITRNTTVADTATTQEGYMCLTTHYIDRNLKLNNKMIAFFAFKPPHTWMHIAMVILQKWQDWGIEKKCSPSREYVHVRCAAHILNIIVQIGLKDIGHTLHKIRESIKFVQASEKRGIRHTRCLIELSSIELALLISKSLMRGTTILSLHKKNGTD
ncbi:unnamed protein product [Arabidopsis thaliana]|uniref:(thale cress) hypothetical protein n=1 Tax=Arabidopsis thaliana TaxID=3702 RepID=A0A7G2F1U4_ARATH|nr:unnamed protein product [Arabidopsis thaliana]